METGGPRECDRLQAQRREALPGWSRLGACRSATGRTRGAKTLACVGLCAATTLLSACGGSAPTQAPGNGPSVARTAKLTGTALKHVRITHPPARVSRGAALLQEVNVVCLAVAHGLPAPPRAPFTIEELRHYAAAAAAPERRLAVSLMRLRKLGDARRLRALARAWGNARAALMAVTVQSKGKPLAESIGTRIQAGAALLASSAARYRVPACGGVAPR